VTALAETVPLPDGGSATYEVVGSGEPLLYFQGGPGLSASLLSDEAARLADRFAVYLIDPPGSGGSLPPADPSGYDHVGHARFYDQARQGLGIERATIMGISFGAIVALTYAALFPDASARCIAIAGRVVGEDEQGDAAADHLAAVKAWEEGLWQTIDARLVAVPDCGHLVPVESPQLFREAVVSFAEET
jgi:pimeloyl-ACP methyl ester carboxylesterase